jgi:hypothetical protein
VTWSQNAVTVAAVLLTMTALAGMIARRRAGVCATFVVYLGVIAVSDLLMLLWPDRFWRLSFFVGKELVINVLRFAVALELTYRTFRAFPSARATARGVLLLVLVATLVVVFLGTGDLEAPEGAPALGPLMTRVQPRVLSGAIWLLTAIAGLILWYRLPVHPLHKAILVGLVPYLLIFSLALSLLESRGWEIRDGAGYLNTLAYLLVLVYWAFAAWRPDEVGVKAPPPAPDPTLDGVTG